MRKFIILTPIVLLLLVTNLSYAEYNPTTGRFLQRDPIGVQDSICIIEFDINNSPRFSNIREFNPIDQYVEGLNIYHYVNSNPINKLVLQRYE